MIVIYIALGIVLAVIILRFLPEILALGLWAIFWGFALILAGFILYFIYLGAGSPVPAEIKVALGNLFLAIFFTLACLALYKWSFEPSWLESTFAFTMLVILLLSGIGLFIEGLGSATYNRHIPAKFFFGVFVPSILVLLRIAVKYGSSNLKKQFTNSMPQRLSHWLGFDGAKQLK